MTLDLCITKHDLAGIEIAATLRLHLDEMYQWSPPDNVHSMPIERLRAPTSRFLPPGTAIASPAGALKKLDTAHGKLSGCVKRLTIAGTASARQSCSTCSAWCEHAAMPASASRPAGPSSTCPRGGSTKLAALPSASLSPTTCSMNSPCA